MAVYHFTVHAYHSWRPDHPRGYVHHTTGVLPPDPLMAEYYDRNARFEPVCFDEAIQPILIRGSHEVCATLGWRLHAGGTDPTHLHLVVSWKPFVSCSDVLNRLKNILSYKLGREVGPTGRRWFVKGGSKRRVFNIGHFTYLTRKYLPDHRGAFWREGMALP